MLQLEFVLYQNSEHKTADITPLLSDAHWKSLRRLCLYKVHAPSAAVSSFLTSHPTIEDLSVSSLICPTPFSLPPGVLPSLKSLNASPEYVTAVLESSTQTPRPLELISGVLLDDSFLALLEQSGSGATLKRLNARTCVDPSLVVKLAKLAPRIEWLSLDYSGSPNHAPVRRCNYFYPSWSQLDLSWTSGSGLVFCDQSLAGSHHVRGGPTTQIRQVFIREFRYYPCACESLSKIAQGTLVHE